MIEGFEAFAQAEFELAAVQSDGCTLREHYEALAERTGRSVADLHGCPDLPEGCELLWKDFMAMHTCRGSNGFGPSRISWMELDAYQRLRKVTFAQWELEAIRRADSAYIASRAERQPKG